MEAALAVIAAALAVSQALTVVLVVKRLADAQQASQEFQERMMQAMNRRDQEFLAFLSAREDKLEEERRAQRQELQTLLNRIQAPEMAVAVTADVDPATFTVEDPEMPDENWQQPVSNEPKEEEDLTYVSAAAASAGPE